MLSLMTVIMHLCLFFLEKVNCMDDDNVAKILFMQDNNIKQQSWQKQKSHPYHFFRDPQMMQNSPVSIHLSQWSGCEPIWNSFVNKASAGWHNDSGTMTIWDRPQLLSPFSVHLSPSINIPRTHIVVQLGPIKRKNEYSVQHNRKWKQGHEIWFSSSWSKCHLPESKYHIAVQRRPV